MKWARIGSRAGGWRFRAMCREFQNRRRWRHPRQDDGARHVSRWTRLFYEAAFHQHPDAGCCRYSSERAQEVQDVLLLAVG